MFSDPQFWVAVSFILFIAAIFNPVRKILIYSLDLQIKEIKNKIEEAENIFQTGDYSETIAKCNECLKIDGNYHEVRYLRMLSNYHMDAFGRALTDANILAERRGAYFDYLLRADIHYRQKSYDKAITDYTTTINLEPEKAPPYSGRAWSKKDKGTAWLDAAVSDFTLAIQKDSVTCLSNIIPYQSPQSPSGW